MKKQKQFKTVTWTAWAIGPKCRDVYDTERRAFLVAGFSGESVRRVRVTLTPLPTRRKAKVKR